MTASETISVKNVGPVETFEFNLPDGGGLVVLLGPQGVGKSQTLHAVDVLVNGRGTVAKRDGTPNAVVTGFGRTLRVKKQTRVVGDMTVDGVGDLDIADLHTPKFKTATTRDRHRIKVLVRLAGVAADIELFRGAFGENLESFDEIISEAARESDDLVDMAARVKRDIEAACRRLERQLETAKANERAKRDAAGDVDITKPADAKQLAEALELAIRTHATRESELHTAMTALRDAASAKERIGALQSPDVDKAMEEHVVALKAAKEMQEAVIRIRSQLDAAEAGLRQAEARVDAASQHLEAERRADELHKELAIAVASAPSEAELDEMRVAVADAAAAVAERRADMEDGVRIRDAQQAIAEADIHQANVKKIARQVACLRGASQEVDTVLSDAIERIPDCPLRVQCDSDGNPRLVCDHPKRGDGSLFDEFSDGERWLCILPLAAGANRAVMLSQAAYGELQPANRRRLHAMARETHCWILTAMADDQPLRAITLDDNGQTINLSKIGGEK